MNGDKTRKASRVVEKGAAMPLPRKVSEFHSRRGHIFRAFLFSLFCVISPNMVATGADYVKVVDDELIMSPTKIYQKESSFSRMTYDDIRRGH